MAIIRQILISRETTGLMMAICGRNMLQIRETYVNLNTF
jgi:hypothetical protein